MVIPSGIELHIEKLVLHGLEGHDPAQLGDAVQREVARLLREQAAPAGLTAAGAVSHLNAGTITLSANEDAREVGRSIAQSVYSGFSQ